MVDGIRTGLPRHSFEREDAEPLIPGVPVQVRFHLLPTAFTFRKGQSIRVAIGGADATHFAPLKSGQNIVSEYSFTIHSDADHLSSITLPIPTMQSQGSITLATKETFRPSVIEVKHHADISTSSLVNSRH